MYKINHVLNDTYVIKGIIEYQNKFRYIAYSSGAKCRVELLELDNTENLSEITAVLGSIKNESLPYVYDVFKAEEQTYIAFEAPYGTNAAVMAEKGRRFGWRDAVKKGIKLLDICTYLHSYSEFPIVHGNINKYTVYDISGKIMMTDIDIDNLFRLKNVQYSEQLQNAFQTDISSVGNLICLLITGEEPKNGKYDVSIIPQGLIKILNKSLGETNEQYNSADEMKAELTGLLNRRRNIIKCVCIAVLPVLVLTAVRTVRKNNSDTKNYSVTESEITETSIRPPPAEDTEKRNYYVEEIPMLGMGDIKYYGDGSDYGGFEDEEYIVIGGEKYRSSVSVLDLRNKGLSDNDILGITEFKNLKSLYLDGNNISDLTEIAKVDTLIDLWLDSNEITSVTPLAKLTNLKRLTVNDNNISDISALSALTELDQLCIQANEINDISAVSSMKKLTKLMMNINNISDLSPLKDITGLEQLYADKCGISDISALKDHSSLKILYLNGNEISDISAVQNCSSLRILSVRGNKITDGDCIGKLTELEYLNISDNLLTSADFAYGLTNLSYLSVSSNDIKDISGISALVNMEELFLRNNPISDLSEITALPNLKTVSLVGCDISESEMTSLIDSLPRVRFLSSYN